MKIKTLKTLYLFALLFAAITAFGQQKQVQTSIDSTKIKIGSQANITIKATVKPKDKVNFPQGKNFGLLEVLEAYPTDTVKDAEGRTTQLIKKYGVTQFDSGNYVIPALPVVINNKTIQTDSLRLQVMAVKVDTLKQKMYDIKGITAAKGPGLPWLWIGIVLGVLLVIGAAVWWFFIRQKPEKEKAAPKVFIKPLEKAARELKALEKKDLLQRGDVKEYYSEMANIARTYIEEAIHIPAMESTTGELIEAMQRAAQRRRMTVKPETFEQLEQILRNADMVKFAKSRPMDFEIAEDRERIEKTIVVIDRSIPEEKEEDDEHTQKWLEEQRLKKEKQKKRLILWSSIGSAAVVLIVVGIIWGVPYVRDNILSAPTKQLAEGTWVKSEYGNPGVAIETPEVLVRMDKETTLPEGTAALVKDMQSFSMGSIEKHFYVEVATLSFKEENDVNFNDWADGIIKTWEKKGAKDILLKSEDFKTDKGIEGVRIYGTLNQPLVAGQGNVDCKYEMYLFKQQKGLQQVVVIGRQGDEFATTIMERIKKSIELRVQ